jgi:ATP-dependent DNA helicase PIF1
LPIPNDIGTASIENRLLLDELSYDSSILSSSMETNIQRLNNYKKYAFDAIISSVMEKKGQTFFIYGYGGIGKTFLWTTLLNFVRGKGKIALAIASSRIAVLLLPGGRTPHSRFKIPLDIKHN